jgi:hypothetical protein
MYDKSAYSYNQTSNVFGVHVHNLPVSEGNEFELDFDIKNVDLNRKIIDPETPSADFVRLIISTQWWITEKDSTNPAVRVREGFEQLVELNGTNGANSVPITFLKKKDVSASSYRIDIIAYTHSIEKTAEITMQLIKKDKSIVFKQGDENTFKIGDFSPNLSEELIFNTKNVKKNMKNGNNFDREFQITLTQLTSNIPFAGSIYTLSTNATGNVSFRSYFPTEKTNQDLFDGKCDFSLTNHGLSDKNVENQALADETNQNSPKIFEVPVKPSNNNLVFTIPTDDDIPAELLAKTQIVIDCGEKKGRDSSVYMKFDESLKNTYVSYTLTSYLPNFEVSKDVSSAKGSTVVNKNIDSGASITQISVVVIVFIIVGVIM